jgi:hypothetical protein
VTGTIGDPNAMLPGSCWALEKGESFYRRDPYSPGLGRKDLAERTLPKGTQFTVISSPAYRCHQRGQESRGELDVYSLMVIVAGEARTGYVEFLRCELANPMNVRRVA